ncbi:hypothetical protein PR002_g3680 [Phytophthora rubi]|uniref:Uncharacterized protein n=1 Tax=Phytophthora rubi TaxID=129364 RepID=A0A6A3NBN3_9STRA|nr:hypothetical protein PR002_g3680 [Phytophthora rubi]
MCSLSAEGIGALFLPLFFLALILAALLGLLLLETRMTCPEVLHCALPLLGKSWLALRVTFFLM